MIKNIGTYASKLAMNSSVTGLIVNSTGNSDGITMKRCYATGTRTGLYAFVNSDTNVLLEHVYGDLRRHHRPACAQRQGQELRPDQRHDRPGVGLWHALAHPLHQRPRPASSKMLCNEPTASSAAQCASTGGTPRFNSSGSLILAAVNDQVTWETDWWVLGYTAFTNSAPTITGTNVTYSSGARWGNHDIEYQIDTGSGWNGTWLALTSANLITHTISASTGFKIKVRVTCATASATNAITNMRIAMTTTDADQGNNLYPLVTVPVTITVKDAATGAAVQNARVRILTDVGSNLVLEGLTNASGVLTGTTEYADNAVTGTVRRATDAYGTRYKPGSISGATTSAGFSATVLLISDE
jgi:hypothetical protein